MGDVTLTVRLPVPVRAALEKEAAGRGMKVTPFAAEILQRGVEQLSVLGVQNAVVALRQEVETARSERTEDREAIARLEEKMDAILATLQKFEGVDV